MDIECPFCHNLIKEVELCPECGSMLIFMPGEGPFGTYECSVCSTAEQVVGFRRSLSGLIKISDKVGRYAPKKKEKVK